MDGRLNKILLGALVCANMTASPGFAAGGWEDADHLQLSYTGDGHLPSAMSQFQAQERQLATARSNVSASPKGVASYQIDLDLPPALFAPSLSLSYSSATGDHTVLARGWDLSVGMPINRVSARAQTHAYAGLRHTLFRINGGGLSGDLMYDETVGEFVYISGSPAPVNATLSGTDSDHDGVADAGDLTWTIVSGGVTTILEPNDLGWGSGAFPMAWRPVHVEDRSGNAIDYEWDGAELQAVSFGYTTTGADDEPTFTVDFTYEPKERPTGHWAQVVAYASRDASSGKLEIIDRRISEIEVWASVPELGAGSTQIARWSLSYGDVNGEELLLRVRQSVGGVFEANFDYEPPGPPSPGLRSSENVPISIGSSGTASGARTTTTRVYTSLNDVSGDGLPDEMSGLGWAAWQELDFSDGETPTSLFSESRNVETPFSLIRGLTQELAVTVDCVDNERTDNGETATFSQRRLVDVDGDGFQDLVISDSFDPPEPSDNAVDPNGWCDEKDSRVGDWDGIPVSPSWTIHYGGPDSFDLPVHIDGVPFAFSRISGNTVLPKVRRVGDAAPHYIFESEVVDLMDMNGDGWSDIVHVDHSTSPASLMVYIKDPDRLSGWSDVPIDYTRGDWHLWSLGQSVGIPDEEELEADLDGSDYVDVRVTIAEMQQLSAFRDLNGDGLLDYVRVNDCRYDLPGPGWDDCTFDDDDTWEVWFGTGYGFSAPVLWHAPRSLSLSDEGKGYSHVCAGSDVAPQFELDAYVKMSSGVAPSSFEWLEDYKDSVRGRIATCQQDYERSRDKYEESDKTDQDKETLVEAQKVAAGCQANVQYDNADEALNQNANTGASVVADTSGSELVDLYAAEGGLLEDSQAALSCNWNAGSPQQQLIGLIDMDGDGRPDLVDADAGEWWRNLGDSFSGSPQDVPAFFDGALSKSRSMQTVMIRINEGQDVVIGSVWEDVDGDLIKTNTNRETFHRVMDVDRDGALDLVSIEGARGVLLNRVIADFPRSKDLITYGDNGHIGLLQGITIDTGAETAISYTPSSYAHPSGSAQGNHRMAERSDLVTEIAVFDPVTGHEGYFEYDYVDGVCEGGVCQGFEYRTTDEYRFDPELSADPVLLSSSATTYLLDRDFAVPTDTIVAMPPGNPWDPAVQGQLLRLRTDLDYQEEFTPDGYAIEIPLGGGVIPADGITAMWVSGRTLTEWGDDVLDKGRSSTVALVRDSFGNVTTSTHTAGQGPLEGPLEAETVTIHTAWALNDDGTLFVPTEQRTEAHDYLSVSTQIVEQGRFFYDDQVDAQGITDANAPITAGLLTYQEVDVGDLAAGIDSEQISWRFVRTPRGAVTHVMGPAGFDVKSDLTYGDALVNKSARAVGDGTQHITYTTYDPAGRPTTSTDSNGVISRTTYDSDGRPIARYVTGVGGNEELASSTTYQDSDVPFSIATTTYNAGLEATSYEVLDGYGSPIQSWRPDETDMGYVVTESIPDIAGKVVRTSYPHREAVATLDFSVRSPSWLAWSEVDAFGVPRLSYADRTADLGLTTTTVPEAGVVETVDRDGYVHRSVSDTLGRLVDVWEGQNNNVLKTGHYAYDGRGRVANFRDAKGNEHRYAYDGGGRLRQVWRRAAPPAGMTPGPFQPYYNYEYDGPLPTKMREGDDRGLVTVMNTYDALGRPVDKQVLNRDTDAFDLYTWEYDTRWVGAVTTTSDPAGYVEYTYKPGKWGRFGRPSSIARKWYATPHVALFHYEYDFLGRTISTTWSGANATVESKYAVAGWHVADDVSWTPKSGKKRTARVDYTYHPDWGVPTGFSGGEDGRVGHERLDSWWSPSRVAYAAYTLSSGGGRQAIWDHDDSGRLFRKTVTGFEPFFYEYDHLQRLSAFVKASGGAAERFEYDDIGNPSVMTVAIGGNSTRTWNYDEAFFSQVGHREEAQTGVFSEDMTFDPITGRMTLRETFQNAQLDTSHEYIYDGMGRLAHLIESGNESRLYYDSANQRVLDERILGPNPGLIARFAGSRWDEAAGELVQEVLPMARLEGDELRWIFQDNDGHALVVYDSDGNEVSVEISGVYGDRIPGLYSYNAAFGDEWELDGVHGGEAQRESGIVHRGVRHALLADGRWLQPEPLLHLGPHDSLMQPRALTGVYAGGNPVVMEDTSGFIWALVVKEGLMSGYVSQDSEGHFRVDSAFYSNPATYTHIARDAAVGTAAWLGGMAIANPAAARNLYSTHANAVNEFVLETLSPEGMSITAGAGAGLAGALDDGLCFAAGTQIAVPNGGAPIEAVAPGDRVTTAADAGETVWAEVEDARTRKLAGWAPRAFAMACAALSMGCDAAELPADNIVVQVYEARTGEWSEAVRAVLEVGDTFVDGGRVLRLIEDGLEVRGWAAVEDLAEADATWVAEAAHRVPAVDDWVLVFGDGADAGHWRLSEVEPGNRFAFQGRVFETSDADADGNLEVRTTEQVLSRVVETFVRQSNTVIDAEIQYEDGTVEVITGTPEHPFYVPALKDWVPLGDLAEGTELHVDSGGSAILVGKTWRQGDFTVYNFEVEGQHNYFVSAAGSNSAGVLVHNSCNVWALFDDALSRQGLNRVPAGFKEKWSADGYDYEVRIHPPEGKHDQVGDILRVSRRKRGLDPNGQGHGWEEADAGSTWHKRGTLKEKFKDGTPNPDYDSKAAKDVHIQMHKKD